MTKEDLTRKDTDADTEIRTKPKLFDFKFEDKKHLYFALLTTFNLIWMTVVVIIMGIDSSRIDIYFSMAMFSFLFCYLSFKFLIRRVSKDLFLKVSFGIYILTLLTVIWQIYEGFGYIHIHYITFIIFSLFVIFTSFINKTRFNTNNTDKDLSSLMPLLSIIGFIIGIVFTISPGSFLGIMYFISLEFLPKFLADILERIFAYFL